MAMNTASKLKIKEGNSLLPINAPADFKKNLGALPAKAKIISEKKGYNQVHWFVHNRAQLEKELNSILKLLKDEVLAWIYYPKGSSKIQTDLTRDKGWDALLQHKNIQWLTLISFDDTWSAFAIRLKNETDKKKDVTKKVRAIFEYADPIKKTVRVPDTLRAAFKKIKKQKLFTMHFHIPAKGNMWNGSSLQNVKKRKWRA